MMDMELYRKARMFESPEIGQLYLLAGFLYEWQQETGKTLAEFLDYAEETFSKKAG